MTRFLDWCKLCVRLFVFVFGYEIGQFGGVRFLESEIVFYIILYFIDTVHGGV